MAQVGRIAPFIPKGHRATLQRFDTGNDLAAHVRLIGYQACRSSHDPDVIRLADDIRHARWFTVHRGSRAIPFPVGRRFYYLHPPDERAQGDMARLWSFMERNVAYLPDNETWDTFRETKASIATGGGDCDDHVIIIDSLAMAMGYRHVGATVIGVDSETPEHIYAWIDVGGHRVTMDTAVPEFRHVARPGWEFPNPKSRVDFTFAC